MHYNGIDFTLDELRDFQNNLFVAPGTKLLSKIYEAHAEMALENLKSVSNDEKYIRFYQGQLSLIDSVSTTIESFLRLTQEELEETELNPDNLEVDNETRNSIF